METSSSRLVVKDMLVSKRWLEEYASETNQNNESKSDILLNKTKLVLIL